MRPEFRGSSADSGGENSYTSVHGLYYEASCSVCVAPVEHVKGYPIAVCFLRQPPTVLITHPRPKVSDLTFENFRPGHSIVMMMECGVWNNIGGERLLHC